MENAIKAEILQIIESVSRERNIPKSHLLNVMEEAVQAVGRKKYGLEHNIKAQINQNTGRINLFKALEVVDVVENAIQQISLTDALLIKPDTQIGDEILDPLPPIDIGRVAAQNAKHVIIQKVNEIEREKQYHDYKDRKGDILNGTVKNIEFGNIILDLGRAEAMLHKKQQIPGEVFRVGDRIKAYVQDVRLVTKGFQILLSRTSDNFLAKLFEMEVPEIYDNLIEIKAIARTPGSKAKIAVSANDVTIDAIGSCVGLRGSRVKAITNELSGEKIDIINWDANIAQFVINAMAPAEITKIVFDEKNHKVSAIIPDDQLSMAIGRRGQNVQLASKITEWSIDVITENQDSIRRTKLFQENTQLFMQELDVDETIAQLLSSEGYTSLEHIVSTPDETLTLIEGFSEELVANLKTRASENIDLQNEQIIDQLEKLGVEQEIIDALDLPPKYILKLAEYGVKTLEDLAEITPAEFRKITPENIISQDEITNVVDFAKKQSSDSV